MQLRVISQHENMRSPGRVSKAQFKYKMPAKGTL